MNLGVVLADPNCIKVVVKEKVFVNYNSLLFWVRSGGKGVPSCGRSSPGSGPVRSPPLLEQTLGAQASLLTQSFLSPPPRLRSVIRGFALIRALVDITS